MRGSGEKREDGYLRGNVGRRKGEVTENDGKGASTGEEERWEGELTGREGIEEEC